MLGGFKVNSIHQGAFERWVKEPLKHSYKSHRTCRVVPSRVLCLVISASILIVSCDLRSVPGNSDPEPWGTQVELALQAAQKVDTTAGLFDVTAFPSAAYFHTAGWDYQRTPIHLEFSFDRWNGNDFMVAFEDTAISSTLSVKNENSSSVQYGKSNLQTRTGILAAAKIGPRDAGLLTWPDALKQASQRGIKISPTFRIELLASNPRWQIGYVASTRGLLDFNQDLAYSVDAKTGAILAKDDTPTNFNLGSP